MIKIFSAILLFVFMCPTFCSCSSTTQIKDRAVIEAVAIDYEDGEYILNLKEHLQTAATGESANIIKSKGKTLFDALKNAESSDGKQIFYGHSGIFLIGDAAAKNGMQNIFDFMNSNYQISLNASVLCCNESAEKIIKLEEFSKSDSDFSIDRIEERGKSVDVTVIDALKTSFNLNGQFYLPLIEVNDKNIKIENCVVFKDYKPQILLDSEETMGLNMLLENIKDGVFVVNQNGKSISVDVVSQNCEYDIFFDGKHPVVDIKITAYGNVSEFGIMGDENERKKQLLNVENNIEKQITKTASKALRRIVTLNQCDIFNLEQRIKKSDNKTYELIQEKSLEYVLSKIKTQISVDFSIRHSGIQVK